MRKTKYYAAWGHDGGFRFKWHRNLWIFCNRYITKDAVILLAVFVSLGFVESFADFIVYLLT